MIIDLRKRKGTKEYNQLFMFRHIGSVMYIYIYIYIYYILYIIYYIYIYYIYIYIYIYIWYSPLKDF